MTFRVEKHMCLYFQGYRVSNKSYSPIWRRGILKTINVHSDEMGMSHDFENENSITISVPHLSYYYLGVRA